MIGYTYTCFLAAPAKFLCIIVFVEGSRGMMLRFKVIEMVGMSLDTLSLFKVWALIFFV